MHNKVVTMAARALRESGATTIRFNFRGVGQSAGEFGEGEGESDDLRAVAAWARQQYPDAQLWLAGFSFGAYVTYRNAAALDTGLLLSIAPPVGRSWDFSDIPHPNCPWLMIQGEADEIVDAQAVKAWAESLKPPPELVLMPETSHFFHRKLMDLRGAIKNGVRPYLPAPAA
jgi:alpha/beta superfamily hydrolase